MGRWQPLPIFQLCFHLVFHDLSRSFPNLCDLQRPTKTHKDYMETNLKHCSSHKFVANCFWSSSKTFFPDRNGKNVSRTMFFWWPNDHTFAGWGKKNKKQQQVFVSQCYFVQPGPYYNKASTKLQGNVVSNIYLFLPQWSKTSLSESLFSVAGWKLQNRQHFWNSFINFDAV